MHQKYKRYDQSKKRLPAIEVGGNFGKPHHIGEENRSIRMKIINQLLV